MVTAGDSRKRLDALRGSIAEDAGGVTASLGGEPRESRARMARANGGSARAS